MQVPRLRLNQSGFSLVELIVVVAIIGILATIVIPSYQKFSHRAISSESKIQLSAIYTAQKAFYAEYNAYHPSFSAFGYAPEGQIRYNIGFTSFQGDPFAGPAHGFTTSLSVSQLAGRNTLSYCDATQVGGPVNIGTCRMRYGYLNQAPPGILSAFAKTTEFTAGATLVVPTNLVARFELDGNMDLFANSLLLHPFLMPLKVLGKLVIEPQVVFADNPDLKLEAVYLDHKKNLTSVRCRVGPIFEQSPEDYNPDSPADEGEFPNPDGTCTINYPDNG